MEDSHAFVLFSVRPCDERTRQAHGINAWTCAEDSGNSFQIFCPITAEEDALGENPV